jgi:hypothetical protein
MAIYIAIRKEIENEVDATYKYISPDGSMGFLRINKNDGSCNPIKIAVGDPEERFYALAARKLFKHFQAGEMPQETCWAS